jgi:hypothetical protein
MRLSQEKYSYKGCGPNCWVDLKAILKGLYDMSLGMEDIVLTCFLRLMEWDHNNPLGKVKHVSQISNESKCIRRSWIHHRMDLASNHDGHSDYYLSPD